MSRCIAIGDSTFAVPVVNVVFQSRLAERCMKVATTVCIKDEASLLAIVQAAWLGRFGEPLPQDDRATVTISTALTLQAHVKTTAGTAVAVQDSEAVDLQPRQ